MADTKARQILVSATDYHPRRCNLFRYNYRQLERPHSTPPSPLATPKAMDALEANAKYVFPSLTAFWLFRFCLICPFQTKYLGTSTTVVVFQVDVKNQAYFILFGSRIIVTRWASFVRVHTTRFREWSLYDHFCRRTPGGHASFHILTQEPLHTCWQCK